jgi:hypothetical protein
MSDLTQKPALTQWVAKSHHKGVFDGYSVSAYRFESATGEIGWDVTTWKPSMVPFHGYWVIGENFHSAKTQKFFDNTATDLVEILYPPVNKYIEPTERAAVLKGIGAWEKPRTNQDDAYVIAG